MLVMLILLHLQATWENREDVPHNIYSESSNRERRSTYESWASRHKRQTQSLGAKNACPLHMRADPLLFDYFKNIKHGHSVVSDCFYIHNPLYNP